MNEFFTGLVAHLNEVRVDYLKILFNKENISALMGIELLDRFSNRNLWAELESLESQRNSNLLDNNQLLQFDARILQIKSILNSKFRDRALLAMLMSLLELGLKYFSYKHHETEVLDYIDHNKGDKALQLHSQSLIHLNPELMYTICAEKYLSFHKEDDAIRMLSYLITLDQERRIYQSPFYSTQIANKNVWIDAFMTHSGSGWTQVGVSKVFWFGSRRIILVDRKSHDGKEEKFYLTLPDDNAWPYEQRGLLLLKLEQYEAAFEDFSNAIKLNPKSAVSYHERAILFIKMNDFAAAEKDYEKIVALHKENYRNIKILYAAVKELSGLINNNPDQPWFYKQRAIIADAYNDKKQALEDYSKLIDLNSDVSSAYQNKINLLLLFQRNSEALEDLSHLIALEPTHAWAYETRAWLYDKVGDYEKAIQDCLKMLLLKLNPSFAHRLKASLLITLGRDNEAEEDLDILSKIYHQDSWVNTQKAFILQKQSILSLIAKGKEAEAIDKLSEIIKNDSQNAWAISERGFLYDKQGEHQKALSDYFKVFKSYGEANPSSQDTNNQKLIDALRQVRKIIDKLSLLIEKNPGKALLYKNRAILQIYFNENLQIALNDFSSMIALNTEVFWASRYRAEVLIKHNKESEALKDLSRLMRLEPKTDEEKRDHNWAYDETANIYAKMGEIDKALDIYNEQIRLNMNLLIVYDAASQLLEKAGRQTESRIYRLSQTIYLHPSNEIGAKARKERGSLYEKMKNYDKALDDYSALIETHMELPFAYSAKAQLFINMGKHKEAIVNLNKLIQLNPKDPWASEEKNKLWTDAYKHLGFSDKAVYPLLKWADQLPGEMPSYFYINPVGEVTHYPDVFDLTSSSKSKNMCPNYQPFRFFKNDQCPRVASGNIPHNVAPPRPGSH